jgi:SNF2 family DNA or RNA helicase
MKILIKSGKIIKDLDIKMKEGKTFKLQGRTTVKGLDIGIENKKGTTRKGVNDDGTAWKTLMNFDYGYIRRTESLSDGEYVDCYVGDDKESDNVFIVNQNNPFTGEFDEQKILLGFNTEEEAEKAYKKQYDNPKFFGSIKEMPFDEFKKKVLATKEKPKMIKAFGRLLKSFGDQLGMFGDAPVNEGDIRIREGKAYQVKRSVKNPQVKRVFAIDKPEPKQGEPQLSIFGQKANVGEKKEEVKPVPPAVIPKEETKKTELKNIGPGEKTTKDIPNLFDQPIEDQKPKEEKAGQSGLDEFGVGHIDKQVRKKRIEINKKVRELLETKKDNEFTDDDKKLLAQYSGRGGTDEVSLNEYYTPDYVAKFQWNMLKKFGVGGGSILEPSCGTGMFLYTAPENMLVTAVEFDETSSRIAKVLFPDHDVHNMSFEKYNTDKFDRGFEGAIGNVPFGIRGATAAEDRERINLKSHEQYFMDRIMDNLEEGGVASIIVPTSIMDNQINEYRLELNKKAEFLGAIRMPTGVFSKANAVVTTDIVFFRKRPDEVIERLSQLKGEELKKLYSAMVLDADFVAGDFFKNNPEFALGEKAKGQFDMDIWKGNITENDLKRVGELLKDVPEDYSILSDLQITPKTRTTLNVGDIKVQNGRTYILNKNHRWERLSEEQADEMVLPEEMQKMFGIKSYAELEELKRDWSRHFDLSREQLKELDSDYDELDNYTDKDLNSNEKLKQAVILGKKIKEFQKDLQDGKLDTSDAQREAQKLVMELDNFKEKYGNPLVDKKILKNLGYSINNPMLYVAGSFDAEGNLSKIYSDPVSFYNVYKTKANIGKLDTENLGSIVNYFFDNNIPASLEMISSSYRGEIGTANIVKDLLKDENIYIDEKGNFAPMQEVCMGEVYNKLDYWASRKEENKLKLTKDDISDEEKELAVLENKKLEDQIFELNRKVGTKNLEDLPVSISDAGRFYSMELLNTYLRDRIPNYYIDKIVFDKGTNLFTFATGILAETYNLYASKGANDLDDKKRLQDLLKYHFNKVDNPYMLMVLNKMNNIPLSIRKDRERIETELNELAGGIKTFLSNSDDADKITDSFNRAFNNYIQKEYDNIPIEGMAKFDYERIIAKREDGTEVTAREKAGDHTWATVRRMYDQGRGMIAHGVGLGKTLQGILLTLLSKQTGRAKKPLIVTPQSVLINWAGELDKWTKDVNYLVVGFSKKDKTKGWAGKNIRKDTTEENKLKLLQIMNNDYDMVLMTRDFFTTLDMSPDTKSNMIEEMVDKFYPGDESTNKKLKKKREIIRQELSELFLKGVKKDKHGKYIGKTDEVYFENLGFDMIMRDEAHDTKNLLVPMEMDVSGLKGDDAKRSYQYYFVSKLIRSANEGKGVFNLTATPISNSPLEVFNMMLPFAEQELEKMGINTMDDFIRRFAEIKTVPTTDPDGRVVERNKFAGWLAPDELRNSFFRFVDYKTYEDVESVKASIKFPRERPNNVLSEMNAGQKELMKHCQKRLWVIKYSRADKDKGARILDRDKLAGAVQAGVVTSDDSELIINHYTNEYLPLYNNLNFNRDPDKKPIDDGYFQIQADMIKITSDLDWYKGKSSNYAKVVDDGFIDQHRELPKFKHIIDNVATLHKQGQKQLVFAINVNLHDKIFKQLVDAGIPANEIKIVNGGTVKGKDRKQVSDDFNSGKYKVIIGNYATMGEGLNFNNGTSDIHHVQPAWNYLQIEQGNGRAIRQGNWQDFVNTHYYLSKGSIDSFMNQKIMDKGKMVDQFLKGEKSTWDEEAQLAAEEMMIALSDNPEVAKRILEHQNKNIQQAIEEKEKTNNFRNFDKLYDMKNRLSKTEDKESRQYKTLAEEIEKTQNQLNNSNNFAHKGMLTLDQKPIILPGNNAVVPVGSVMRYSYNEGDNSFVVIDDYAPSTGKISVTVWTPEKTERKKIDIKLFASQYDQTIKHSGFDTEEMFNKIIKDGEMSSAEMFYKLPADTLKKHKKDIIKNLRDTTERVLYRDKNNKIKADYADDAVQEIDNEGGRFIFPQEDEEFEKFLFQNIKAEKYSKGRTPDDYWHIKHIAEKMYGYEYYRVLENKLKKKKGEATTEPELEEAA